MRDKTIERDNKFYEIKTIGGERRFDLIWFRWPFHLGCEVHLGEMGRGI
jgi:hypothetical protein